MTAGPQRYYIIAPQVRLPEHMRARQYSIGGRSGLDGLRRGTAGLRPGARGKSVPCSAQAQNEFHQPIPGLLKLSRHEIGGLGG